MENSNIQLIINQALYFIIHIIILIASIIIANKSKTIGGLLLVISAILTLLITIIQVFINNIFGAIFGDSALYFHSILLYVNVAIYLMFGVGLLLFAINYTNEKR